MAAELVGACQRVAELKSEEIMSPLAAAGVNVEDPIMTRLATTHSRKGDRVLRSLPVAIDSR